MGIPSIQSDFKLNLFFDDLRPSLDFTAHTFYTRQAPCRFLPMWSPAPSSARWERSRKLYLFDLQLFLWILPRGVKMTIRLATMIFLRLGLITSTAYVNFALVSTIKADRGMIEPNTLTMSTSKIIFSG